MTIESVYNETRKKLSHLDSSDLEARWIVSELTRSNEIEIWANPKKSISEEDFLKISQAVVRRQQGEPLAYILGFKEFYNLRFYVDSSTLIPRPETEILVEQSLKKTLNTPNEPLAICDLGAGSGCIGLTLLKHRLRARLLAVDISSPALEVTLKNATLLGVENRVEIVNEPVRAEIFQDRKFDLVVSNPPYISPSDQNVAPDVRRYEPASALYADNEGSRFLEEWLAVTKQILKPGGLFAFEFGKGQNTKVSEILKALELDHSLEWAQDLQGITRAVIGRK